MVPKPIWFDLKMTWTKNLNEHNVKYYILSDLKPIKFEKQITSIKYDSKYI